MTFILSVCKNYHLSYCKDHKMSKGFDYTLDFIVSRPPSIQFSLKIIMIHDHNGIT